MEAAAQAHINRVIAGVQCNAALPLLSDICTDIERNTDAICAEIDAKCDELVALVQRQRETLKLEARARAAGKIAAWQRRYEAIAAASNDTRADMSKQCMTIDFLPDIKESVWLPRTEIYDLLLRSCIGGPSTAPELRLCEATMNTLKVAWTGVKAEPAVNCYVLELAAVRDDDTLVFKEVEGTILNSIDVV